MKTIFILVVISFSQAFNAQTNDIIVQGRKESYSVLIPEGYVAKKSIGTNVDLKYVNHHGCSVVTVVREILKKDFDKEVMASDLEIKESLELSGHENVTIIKRGTRIENGVKTYVCIFEANGLYNYSVSKYFNKKLISLNYGVLLGFKDLYKMDAFKVSNSLKIIK